LIIPAAPAGGSRDETNALRVSSTAPIDDDQHLDWTLALAGGDGVRLQDYIERKCGRRIPKQYCQLLGSRSMLEHTLARLNQLTPASRTLTVIGTDHKAHAMPQLSGSSDHVFCQPSSRDTGVALYVALAMIRRWSPNATVTITPTDHYVEPNERYLQHIRVARHIATRVRDLVVLLGVSPSEPDPDFGYIMTGGRLIDVPQARTVVGFVEKPIVARAEQLIGAGALWNTMVTCGTVDALWSLGRSAVPKLIAILDCLVPLIGTSDESDAIDYIYRAYRPVSFSTDVLQHRPDKLAVIELNGVEWSDWGRPERVETTLAMRRNRASIHGVASSSPGLPSGSTRRAPRGRPPARDATACSSQTRSEFLADSPISSHHHLGDDLKPRQ
jgi:mannose-1-phosphate guanylyltransferase